MEIARQFGPMRSATPRANRSAEPRARPHESRFGLTHAHGWTYHIVPHLRYRTKSYYIMSYDINTIWLDHTRSQTDFAGALAHKSSASACGRLDSLRLGSTRVRRLR